MNEPKESTKSNEIITNNYLIKPTTLSPTKARSQPQPQLIVIYGGNSMLVIKLLST